MVEPGELTPDPVPPDTAPPAPEPPAPEATMLVSRPSGPTDPVMVRLIEVTAGQYRVERELGRGGMAAVYLGHDLSLDRQVAIKVMSPDLFNAGQEMVDRFLREARTGARLNHPHIIPVYAVREERDLIFFVMKFINGRPLDAIVRKLGPLPIPAIGRLISQSADALAYAHRNGIIHRDIKPSNLMLDKEGWVVVTDLGIAKVQDTASLTATGSAIGTPTYMSPEQSMGSRQTTAAADQYSLGCVAYELLTGAPPFQGESVVSLIFQHHADPPPPIHPVRPDAPPEMVSAVMRMLQKAPEDRFSDMDGVAQVFREATRGTEEELRELLSALASGDIEGGSVPRVTPRPRTPIPRPTPATPRPAEMRTVSMGSAAGAAAPLQQRRTPAPGSTTVPRPNSTTPAVATRSATADAAQNWPRTLIRPPEQQRRSRRALAVPSASLLLVIGALTWLFGFPRAGTLGGDTPSVTALMALRQSEAEAMIRRGTAPGEDGSCTGVRNALPSCRTMTAVPLEDVAPVLRRAVIAAQDPAFDTRTGVDWVSVRQAAGYPREAFDLSNAVDRSDLMAQAPKLLSRMVTVGRAGSITQLLVQTLWFPADSGLLRKTREIAAARRLGAALSRDRILELYLNVAEFGPGLYGVEAAAQAYFGVKARDVSASQAAALAAMLATPHTSTLRERPEAMRRRQALILRRLNGESVDVPPPWAIGVDESGNPSTP